MRPPPCRLEKAALPLFKRPVKTRPKRKILIFPSKGAGTKHANLHAPNKNIRCHWKSGKKAASSRKAEGKTDNEVGRKY